MTIAYSGDSITFPDNSVQNTAPKVGMVNRIINGNFDIWQRGTSFSNPSGDTYTADRFFVPSGAGTSGDTISQQSFAAGQTDVPNNPTYFLRFAAGASVSNRSIQHRIEDVRTFAGQPCTLSFWAKASVAHTSTIEIQQNFGSGGSAAVTQSAVSYSMTTSWQKFTFTQTLPSISGKTIGTSSYVYIALIRSLGASNVSIDIAQIQFESGSTATSFDYRPYGTELALCQRYCLKLGGASYTAIGAGVLYNDRASSYYYIKLTSTMRVVPTTTFASLIVTDRSTYDTTVSSLSTVEGTGDSISLRVLHAATGTAGYPVLLTATSATSGYLLLSAEL